MIFWRALANQQADGYSYASTNISSRLKDLNVLSLEDISRSDTESSTVMVDPVAGIRIVKEPDFVKLLINNCLPPNYSFGAEYVVGFTYWETTLLPSSWVHTMNRCDEIWTTSAWAKDCFINSGINVPVFNFELGVDTDIFKPNLERTFNQDRRFTFLHIGSPSTRKNTQLVYNAFKKLFRHDERYRLIIKSNGPPDARKVINDEIVGSLYDDWQVKVIDGFLTDQELSELFDTVDCFIYPTRGEGWGMAPFQAIAKGIPTICTNATSCTEFAHLSVPLEAELSSDNLFGIYQTGQWANPKIDDVCDRMLYVINNYDTVLEKTMDGSKFIHENYSWDQVVLKFKQRILEINKNV